MQSTKRADETRVAGRSVLALMIAAVGLLLTAPSGDGAVVRAQAAGRWVLSSTDVNPATEVPPPNWSVTTTNTSMSVTETFGPDDDSGAEAQFDAAWSAPPAELEPGVNLELPITVSGEVTGNRDTQFYFGLDVIMVVNGRWNDSAVGARASCSQTTVISGVYECSEPETTTGVLTYGVATGGEEYTVAVGALNCGSACAVRWTYDWVEEAVGEPVGGDPAADEIVPPGGGVGAEVPAESGTERSTGPPFPSDGIPVVPIAVVVVAAGAAVLIIRGRSAPGTGGESDRPRDERDEHDEDEDEDDRSVRIRLTYPVGRSPFVLQYGWHFAARAVVDAGTPDERDVSDSVRWSGPAEFTPSVGRRASPAFHRSPGVEADLGAGETAALSITLSVDVDGVTSSRTFPVMVISTSGYARVTDESAVAADTHGCPACPHACTGPIMTGNLAGVTLGGLPVATVGDRGIHAACCGPNTYEITSGDARVLIDGRPAAWRRSTVAHCGGPGTMTTAHPGGR